ncbi:hypothetical protein SVXHr_2000 [Halorhabdus sp. SVX81]|nr:hypothetical protein SVXHr_2000 [Halorhabdus sp. SVX81]
MTKVTLLKWDPFVVPRLRGQTHHDVLFLVERMGSVIHDDPSSCRVLIRLERVWGQNSVSSFE